jgi:hypothetical protein
VADVLSGLHAFNKAGGWAGHRYAGDTVLLLVPGRHNTTSIHSDDLAIGTGWCNPLPKSG